MTQQSRFHVERINPQNTEDVQATLNGLLEREDVAELVDWEAIEANRNGEYNLIMEYVPA